MFFCANGRLCSFPFVEDKLGNVDRMVVIHVSMDDPLVGIYPIGELAHQPGMFGA